MHDGGKIALGLLATALAAAAGCKRTADQQAAVAACRKYGDRSEQCALANRMLASGAGNIQAAIEAEERTRAEEARRKAEAERREREMAQAGQDPCEVLRQKLIADHPAPACKPKIEETVTWLKDDPGCAAALGDPDAVAETAENLLGDCDSAAP